MFPLEEVGLCSAHLGTLGDAPLGLGVNHQEEDRKRGLGFTVRGLQGRDHQSLESFSVPP